MLNTTLYKTITKVPISCVIGASSNIIPFSDKIVKILLDGQNQHGVIKIIGLGADFYVTLLMKDVLAKRATGIEGFDPLNGVPCFIFKDIQYISWATKINPLLLGKINYIDSFMYTYICAACAGELRHSPGHIGHKISAAEKAFLDMSGVTHDFQADQSRSGTQKRFLQLMTPDKSILFLEQAVNIFGNYDWGSGYGGKKWSAVAKCALDRAKNKLDKIGFIDRAFDLKHNGGPIFDKNKAVDQGSINQFLDAKLHATKDKDWTKWLPYCTPEVMDCLKTAKHLGLWEGDIVEIITKPKKKPLHELYGEQLVDVKSDVIKVEVEAPEPEEEPEEEEEESTEAVEAPTAPAAPAKPGKSSPVFEAPTEPVACPTGKHT